MYVCIYPLPLSNVIYFSDSVKDQVLQFTTQTIVVSSCLIISTITLFMVVIVLCQLRKRDCHTSHNHAN